MVVLGVISGSRKLAQEHRALVELLETNNIPYSGGGSRMFEIDVPASKYRLAFALLQTNRLVLEHTLVLVTNIGPNWLRGGQMP
jgi:hypothetical protein